MCLDFGIAFDKNLIGNKITRVHHCDLYGSITSIFPSSLKIELSRWDEMNQTFKNEVNQLGIAANNFFIKNNSLSSLRTLYQNGMFSKTLVSIKARDVLSSPIIDALK